MAAKKSVRSAAAAPGLSDVPEKASATVDAGAPETTIVSDADGDNRPMHKSVGWALTVLARLHRVELGERLAALGLFPGQEQLLQALHDNETMTMGALADFMRVRPPTASKAVVRLSVQGLVERADGAGDGRVVRVRLTEEGRVRAIELASLWHAAERKLLDGFDQRDRKKMRKLLRRAADNFAGAPEPSAAAPVDGAAVSRNR